MNINNERTLKNFKTRQLASIHILKADLKLDEAEYRRILRDHGKADSAKHMTALGRARVLKHLKMMKVAAHG